MQLAAVRCSYLQLAAGESINKPCNNRWSRLIETNHLLCHSDLFMTVAHDYWDHCASIIASHLVELEKEKQEINQEEAFYLCKLGDAYNGV